MSASSIVEVCVYRQSSLRCHPGSAAEHGVELTRLVKYTPERIGSQKLFLPIEQNDVDIATVKVDTQEDLKLAVLDVALDHQLESYESKVQRFERAYPLYTQYKTLTRTQASLLLTLRRLKLFEEHLHKLPEEGRKSQLSGERVKDKETNYGVTYVESLAKLLDVSVESQEKVSDEIFKTTRELERVNAELKKCERELYDLCSGGLVLPRQPNSNNPPEDCSLKYEELLTTYKTIRQSVDRHQLAITLDVEKIEPLEFKVRYCTRGGHWTAAYDLKVDSSDLTKLNVFYYARIQQNTSEDWKNVDLTISTGRMSIAGAPPQLKKSVVRPEAPKFVSHPPPGTLRHPAGHRVMCAVARPPMHPESATMMSRGMLMAAPAPVEMLSAAPVETTSTQAAYKIGQKVTILADIASPTQFLISNVQLPMRTIYYCAPEVDLNVFRACRLTNTSDYYLVDSPQCSIFWGGSYIGLAKMPSVAPGDSFNLFLGQAKLVQIKVNPPKHLLKSGGGMLNQKDRLYYERVVMVSNYEPAEVMMFLAFNLIEAQDDDIKVSLDKINDVIEISAEDDLTIMSSPKFPTSVKRLQWIYNPVTRNCIALLVVKPQAQELLTFATVIESPNGRVISIKPIRA